MPEPEKTTVNLDHEAIQPADQAPETNQQTKKPKAETPTAAHREPQEKER